MIYIINSFLIFFIKLLPKSLIAVFAKQYVAGQNINNVLNVAQNLNKQGFKATIDILGEHFNDKHAINKITSEYKELYKEIKKRDIDSNISIKPTHIGLDISLEYALMNFKDISKVALKYDNFLRIDMESSKVTDDTLFLNNALLESRNTGPVFQAYLRRTFDDIRNIKDKSSLNFRLCKGIYKESADIAFTDYNEINNNYLKILKYAFQNKIYVGIATHDKQLIDQCYELIKECKVQPDDFEFQVLYGVPMDAYLEKHKQNNYNVRVYIPYGEEWYEYSIRRMKENPNILIYVLKNMFKN